MLAGGGISRSSNKTMDTSRYGDGLASKSFSSVWSPKGLCLLHIGEIVKKKKKSDVLFAVVNSLNNFYSTPKIFLFRYIFKKESSFIVKLLIFKIGS